MAVNAVMLEKLPPELSRRSLTDMLEDIRNRENFLRAQIQRYEQQYGLSLEDLEQRLDRGEGSEHPDWEDSIAWRNCLDAINRQDKI